MNYEFNSFADKISCKNGGTCLMVNTADVYLKCDQPNVVNFITNVNGNQETVLLANNYVDVNWAIDTTLATITVNGDTFPPGGLSSVDLYDALTTLFGPIANHFYNPDTVPKVGYFKLSKTVATKAALNELPAPIAPTLVTVTADESNGNKKTKYILKRSGEIVTPQLLIDAS